MEFNATKKKRTNKLNARVPSPTEPSMLV